jgi:hypothetical protein
MSTGELAATYLVYVRDTVKKAGFSNNLKDFYMFAFESYEDAVICLKTRRDGDNELIYHEGNDYIEQDGEFLFSVKGVEFFLVSNSRHFFTLYYNALKAVLYK